MKKGDWVVIALVIFSVIVSAFFSFTSNRDGKTVVIKRDDKVLCRYSLFQNRTVDLETNVVEIKDGKVFMESSVCKNQICVNHRPIEGTGETIVCLPNGIIVEIKE